MNPIGGLDSSVGGESTTQNRQPHCLPSVATRETTDIGARSSPSEIGTSRAGSPRRNIVVARAEGARVWDVDGRSFIDFAGGIACQNTGHGFPPVVAAIHEQADRYLHQCFMVGVYEPYVEVCKRLAELSPCGGGEQRSILVNSGAEAIENAVKIARAATGRPAVIVFENAFHGRTLLTMTMTAKLTYKKGFGPFAPEVYRAPGPYPYRGVSSDAALEALEDLFRSDVDPESVACAVLEPVQGEGGFIPMPDDFPGRLKELLSKHGILYVDDEVQSGIGRTGPVWAIEHYGVEPDIVVSGKSLGGGLPLAGVTGRAEVMDAPHPGGLGGTFGGNPLSCAAALAVLDEVATPEFRATGGRARHSGCARRSTSWRRRCRPSARCAASARCWPSSSSPTERRGSRTAISPSGRSSSRGSAASCSSPAACTGTSCASCRR